ncbi:1-phosphofructokinase family hexose kinase [uncultured Cetobacterium sp.]|uniref:1-phosphofructokinase family hexose kinase n=1 Tax=uncultured Cetobacterium sp. TaxID=527638 RepID=UPI002604D4B1|nr:1-phosphofructokinase family hexose kinase [uncultured Cetobacterium sp.]
MILTITLNPAIDIRYEIDNFEINSIFRGKGSKTAGGKGLNVSRVLRLLGENVEASGFLGGSSGDWISSKIESIGIKDNFIKTDTETRSCIAILGKGTQTEILEPGEKVSSNSIDKFLEFFKNNFERFEIICISGSAPQGVQNDIYKVLCEIASSKKVILDTSGKFLLKGIEGNPYLIKPNKEELEGMLGRELLTFSDLLEGAKEIKNKGCKNLLVSLGKDGAIFINEKNDIYRVNIPKVEIKNPVGSGDSTIAGFAYGLNKKKPIEETLKLAMACGISNAMMDETGKIDLEIVKELFDKVKIEKV